MATENLAGLFSQVATSASEQGHANFIGKIVAEKNRKSLAGKLNTRLDKFRQDVADLIIGTPKGLFLKAETRKQEHAADFTGDPKVTYKPLSKSWLKRKQEAGAPLDFFVFGEEQPRKKPENKPQQFLGPYLEGALGTPSALFGKVRAKDIQIFTGGQRVTLIGGRLKDADRRIKEAGGTSGRKIRNFSPHDRRYEVRVQMLHKVSNLEVGGMALQYFVANLLDSKNNAASGFARSKLSDHALGRPNVGQLLLWYYQVKLPAVMRSHYSRTRVLEI